MPKVLSAGLPNITGEFATEYGHWAWSNHPNSAIYSDSTTDNNGGSPDGVGDDLIKFDASRSNSIYDSSDTVQPPTLQLIPNLRY